MKNNRNIAVIGIKGLPSKGGAERVAELIISDLLINDYYVTVYGRKGYSDLSRVDTRINLIEIPAPRGKHLNAFSYGIWAMLHALIKGKYDFIHVHCADYGYIIPLLRLKYRVIGTSHGAEYYRDKWSYLAKLFFKFSEILFVKHVNVLTSVSEVLKEYYNKKYNRDVYFIPNGLKINEQIELDQDLSSYNLPREFLVFAAGRIIPSKGCDLLLKAYSKLSRKIPLIVIGDLNWDRDYKNYIKGLASPEVQFIDFIADKRTLLSIINKSKFFIFPSTYEAMSVMLLEVAYLKKGIICSDIAQNKDAIGDNAIFFKSGNVEELARKIDFAVNNQLYLDTLGSKAYEYIIKNRNWDLLKENYLTIFKKIGDRV